MESSLLINKGSADPKDKDEIRNEMREILQCLSREEHKKFSGEALEWLMFSKYWKKSKVLYLFMNVRNEINTKVLIEKAWETNKKVYLPKCRKGEFGIMDFIQCKSFNELAEQTYGILEPKGEANENPDKPDMILVPGVAFTESGLRLGNGAGYYDRFNSSVLASDAVRIGYSFSFQILDQLPEEEWDVPVQFLCTNSGIRSTGIELEGKWR